MGSLNPTRHESPVVDLPGQPSMKKPFEHSANVPLGFEEAMRNISVPSRFSLSIFTLEINGRPTLTLQAKWHAEADRLGRDWVYSHLDQISSKGPYGTELPPLISVRVALAAERAAFEADSNDDELYDGVKVLRLIEAAKPESGGC
jgi:hypothetical protein